MLEDTELKVQLNLFTSLLDNNKAREGSLISLASML